nr:MAG TPA: hypothetical protein [Caudoviricetes sp.]
MTFFRIFIHIHPLSSGDINTKVHYTIFYKEKNTFIF